MCFYAEPFPKHQRLGPPKVPCILRHPVAVSLSLQPRCHTLVAVHENETIRNYRERIRQCEAIGEFAMAKQIRDVLVEEQDHQDLATALGEEVPDLGEAGGPHGRSR